VGLALVLTSLGIGYQLGSLSNSNPAVTPSNDTKECIPEPKEMTEKAEDENVDEDEDEELEDIADGDLGSISAGFLEPCKLVHLITYFITFPSNWHRFWLFVQILT
jgi:peptidyl-tRNA hydrolase, PTH2 family